MDKPKKRGLACVSPARRRAISKKGGKAVSKDKAHMKKIGRRGGKSTSSDSAFMAKIGRLGGSA